tara:strand:- start:159 stop:896 length:738 start_codon:yes stop_codon:yes gene_type:complete
MKPEGVRIAMWSGPRNISTALLRSWGNRPDTLVNDEPLYGAFLSETGYDHPVAAEIISHYETDWSKVVAGLTGEIPGGKSIYYQKHMAHHLLPGMGREWVLQLDNCFLLREPREMLTSLIKILPDPGVADTGLPQQLEIFRLVEAQLEKTPPVLASRDVLEAPERLLGLLCEELGVEFSPSMLSWPPGKRDTDGIWAPHWYGEVEKSTSFRPYKAKDEEVPGKFRDLLRECMEIYQVLYEYRLGK